jgi:hypothetical protein
MMDSGFDTIGNAVLIAYDRGPMLVTDPWLSDSSYFGSWTQSHEIPAEQREAIKGSRFVWVSHGHPDHLDSTSLRSLQDKTILLPDHVGKRISANMSQQGYTITVLKDREWYSLSDRLRVLCISDSNQDAILLVDVNGRLVVNQNDASDHGWGPYVSKIVNRYDKSFLLALSGRYGNADMINFLDEGGNRIPPRENSAALGAYNAIRAQAIDAKAFIPFSSMHRYQRADSVWANVYHTSLEDYHVGFSSKRVADLPAFIRYDCLTDTYTEINPPERPLVVRQSEEFGDYWDQTLEPGDVETATEYFRAFEHLSHHFDFINLRAGGKDNVIRIGDRKRYDRGVTFGAPRKSLMTSIQYRFFDDMLIANFMTTTLHGRWNKQRLYPDFTPYVAKYGDNGLSRSDNELQAYMRAYRKRTPLLDYLRYAIEQRSAAVFRSLISERSPIYEGAKRAYWYYKRGLQ